MDAATRTTAAGFPRLLVDVARVERVTDGAPTAQARLETLVGAELAARLVGALSRRHGRCELR